MSEERGGGGGGLPGRPAQIPGVPENAALYELSQFKTLNTKAPRASIKDQEMAWCENMMPVDNMYLRSLYDKGAVLYTVAGATGATGGGGCKSIILTTGTSMVVPSDWNPANNTIEAIGGGAGGASAFANVGGQGGGGGGYTRIENYPLVPGATITFQIGQGGPGGLAGVPLNDQVVAGTDTWLNDSNSVRVLTAKAGIDQDRSALGSWVEGYTGAKFQGGMGAILNAANGGGGAAGPNGSGNNGLGGSTNGSAPGGSADAGSGGAGGSTPGAPGGSGGEWGSGGGAGGGGAGGLIGNATTPDGTGGAGGLYGGGGGGAAWAGGIFGTHAPPPILNGAPGGQGAIRLYYCPA